MELHLRLQLLAVLLLLGCRPAPSQAASRAPGTRTTATPARVNALYEGGLKGGWEDHGWCARGARTSGPELLDLTNYCGWILANRGLEGTFGGVVFSIRLPPGEPDFLELRVDNESSDVFPRVRIGPQHGREGEDGWAEIFVPMTELNPENVAFSRVVIRAHKALKTPGFIAVDHVGLTAPDPSSTSRAGSAMNTPGTPAAFSVDCKAGSHEISPLIYGIAFSARSEYREVHQFKLGATARRWGGNPTSRYNWELGNAWNTASDYFFQNVDYTQQKDFTWNTFLEANADRHLASVMTVPLLGWVAKDTSSSSFPTSEFGKQQASAPDRPVGNGLSPSGTPLLAGNPKRTSIEATPEFIGRWISAITAADAKRDQKVAMYLLDNEPMLWHDTHRDVHPAPVSYDELLQRTVSYGTAIRKANPQAVIGGPASWGWPEYFYSAVDAQAGFSKKPDRLKHGDVPLLAWYLQQLAEHEKKTGTTLLNVVDVHFYPQGRNLGVGPEGATDADTAARRIRSVRALWDPGYTDESWINEPIELIPRLRRLVAENYPGRGLAIGEYSFGAERHMSGGLAQAEALGRFGQQALTAAFYWTYPAENSPAFWAFRAFRDYDGRGSHFLDWSLPTSAPRDTSLFASRNKERTKLTLVALNFSVSDTFEANITLTGCPAVKARKQFTYLGDANGFFATEPATRNFRLPRYSITVIELDLATEK
jgi:hypothetical protein